jgi:serralysin
MVFKALAGGASGDLANATDFYGYFADTVLITDNAFYEIRTYEKNDLIDASRVTAVAIHTVYAGSGDDTFLGNSDIDLFYDGSGNDKGSLGSGNDFWFCGSGNDIVNGGNGVDWLYFQWRSNDGLSALQNNTSGVTVDLAISVAQNLGVFGRDTITGFENVFGGNCSDTFRGSSAANFLGGNDGNDTLDGRSGNDTLAGNNGQDVLIGGRGSDIIDAAEITPARDVVKFISISDSGIAVDTERDQINNFDSGGTLTDDKIDLSAIDARPSAAGNQAFIFRGLNPFSSAAGEVRLEIIGPDTLVHVDNDSDIADEMTFWVRGVTTLTAADFVL